MPMLNTCLIDVYDTILSTDFRSIRPLLADAAGVDAAAFDSALDPWWPLLGDGRATFAEVLDAVLRDLGQPTEQAQIAELVALDREQLTKAAVLYQDTVPFLRALRARSVRTAIVSNCMENTRAMLENLGIDGLVDEFVLSCEVRAAKPGPEIFNITLERLGATAAETVFVDDQQVYCDGAAALGIRAIRIDRSGSGDAVPDLASLAPLF
jgi:HAD superfamily hydrolase (TIGR01509 family)